MFRVAARIAALFLAVVAVLLTATAAADAATHRLFGGQVLPSASSAPSTVLILSGSGSSASQCTGSILDATHVLTAAHCTRNEQGQPFPSGSSIFFIGMTSLDSDEGLVGPVLGARVHPAYNPATGQADVAVLQVPKMALGGTITAMPIVDAGAAPAAGTAVRAFGWGESGNSTWDGNERVLDLTVGVPTDCWSGVAAVGCAQTPTGGPCPGDSGGPVVRNGVQVGVTDTRIGAECVAGSQLGFADLSAPSIAQFVRGNDSPPPLPSMTGAPSLAPPPLTGGAATCTPPTWANAASTSTVFFHRDAGTVVQEGPATTYVPKPSDAGHELGCRSIAQAPGGSAVATAPSGVQVLASQLTLRARGASATVSYTGASALALSATLTNAKGHKAWTKTVDTTRSLRLPKVRAGVYRLCVDAPAAGQFASAQACQRWRAPVAKRRGS